MHSSLYRLSLSPPYRKWQLYRREGLRPPGHPVTSVVLRTAMQEGGCFSNLFRDSLSPASLYRIEWSDMVGSGRALFQLPVSALRLGRIVNTGDSTAGIWTCDLRSALYIAYDQVRRW
jgi:hypothetical protein